MNLGKEHKAAMGEDTHINKYGYPDIGNNIYSDYLPYKDWVIVNNAQRAHENIVNNLPIAYSGIFICGLSYPRLTLWYTAIYVMLRISHTTGFMTNRGPNRVAGTEEFLKLTLSLFVLTGFFSSLNIMGFLFIPKFLHRFGRFVPKRFKKVSATEAISK